MSSPGPKISVRQLSTDSIAWALFESEGYAAFEYLGDGQFQPIGAPPEFVAQLLGEAVGGEASARLADRMPFLEGFLIDAEECWKSESGRRAESGPWIECVEGGRELALEASAFRLADKRVLLIRNPQQQFAQQSELLQKARDSALEHERLLREIQKKEILLHCVIHDLSQPLAAMRGCFSLLAAHNLSPELREIIEIGQRQSSTQEEMIRGILEAFSAELAAQDSAAHDSAHAPDLARTARQVAEDYSTAFASKGARIELDPKVDPGRARRVVGDEPRLRRIYANLIENALRYSPAGSTVTLGLEDDGVFRRAWVDDQGPGLPTGPEAPRLFSLFAKGKQGGGKAGLGLYFCKITIERWGGTIGAENRTGGGTRFWFRLPKVEEQSAEPRARENETRQLRQAAEVGPQSGRRLRLLLADDTPVNRQITALLLAKQGHEVIVVENGLQALAELDKQRFDAVILDEEMPEMGGLETVRTIRGKQAGTGQRLPVILVTANSTDAARQRARDAGVDAHIAKPFHDDELFRTLEDLCGVRHAPPSVGNDLQPVSRQFDSQQLLRRVGGSPKMLRDVARIFIQDTPRRKSAIRQALARHDGAALAAAAHALRGAVAMLGAVEIADEIRKIETLGREGSIAGASELFTAIESTLSAFERRIAEVAGGSQKRTKPARSSRRAGAPRSAG